MHIIRVDRDDTEAVPVAFRFDTSRVIDQQVDPECRRVFGRSDGPAAQGVRMNGSIHHATETNSRA